LHIVVTLAGHSRRFAAAGYRGPKALLEIGDKRMIQHVVDMFDPADRFHFVVNRGQLDECPEMADILKSLARNAEVVAIPAHERGPVWSALAVASIPEDDEVIVTYCDLAVDWNYGAFLRRARGHHGAISAFRGFQPASFGTTHYAYMRADRDRMLELREKKSFTTERHLEPASTGIYYFGSWKIFRDYSRRLLEDLPQDMPEAYVSLLYNLMVRDGLDVVLHDVDRFICLGTPEDVEQYRFWWRYFRDRGASGGPSSSKARRVNMIPMAGSGNRFRQEGYRVAKPLIPVRGEPMALRAARSMPPADNWIFLPRRQDLDRHPIERALRRFSKDCTIVPVDSLTSGQAATCLLAADSLHRDDELFISSCDYEVRFDFDSWNEILANPSIDGAIWTYRMRGLPIKNPDAFAYCRVVDRGGLAVVTEVVEKRRISSAPELDPMVVGSFWYRRAEDFVFGARRMIEQGISVNGEHYVGTSINQLIEAGKTFVAFDVEQWISFGDPFELRVLEWWDDHFAATRRATRNGQS
jgi:NDP-sugar pyrophosphorylase family protein